MIESDEIVICKYCRQPEFWDCMRWLSGKCLCRNCYREEWEAQNFKPYAWNDLEGRRPTIEEYNRQTGG